MIKNETRVVVPGPGGGVCGEGIERYCLMCTVSAWDDEKVLEMGSDYGCTTVWMFLMLFNCALQMVKMVYFILYIFYYNKRMSTVAVFMIISVIMTPNENHIMEMLKRRT